MKTHNFVYCTTNNINGKKYIGVHSTDDMNDGYLGSGKILKQAIKRSGRKNFTREIMIVCDTPDEAYFVESLLVDDEIINDEMFYNIVPGGSQGPVLTGPDNGFYGKRHTEEVKKHLSEKHTGKTLDSEHVLKISKKSREQWNDPIWKENVISSRIGRKHNYPQNHMQHVFDYRKHLKEENKKLHPVRMSKLAIDMNSTPEIKRNRKTTNSDRHISNETKMKMKERKQGYIPTNKGKLTWYDPIWGDVINSSEQPEGFLRGTGPRSRKRVRVRNYNTKPTGKRKIFKDSVKEYLKLNPEWECIDED